MERERQLVFWVIAKLNEYVLATGQPKINPGFIVQSMLQNNPAIQDSAVRDQNKRKNQQRNE